MTQETDTLKGVHLTECPHDKDALILKDVPLLLRLVVWGEQIW